MNNYLNFCDLFRLPGKKKNTADLHVRIYKFDVGFLESFEFWGALEHFYDIFPL